MNRKEIIPERRTPMSQDITRIELDQISHELIRTRSWAAGWREGDSPVADQLVNDSLIRMLGNYERQGYTVEMAGRNTGRALRGQITRMDFLKIGHEFRVKKYPHGWGIRTRPLAEVNIDAAEFAELINQCEVMGWTVLRHPSGNARAYRGESKPVVDAETILRLRRRYPRTPYDLAYYAGLVD